MHESPHPIDSLSEGQALERHLRAYVARHYKALTESWEFWAEDDPVEAVHEVRVASRRLRALVEAFGHLTDSGADARRWLRRVTRDAGPLREWDVQAIFLKQLAKHPSSQLESASLEHIGLIVQRERARWSRRLRRQLEQRALSRAQRLLSQVMEQLVEVLAITPARPLAHSVIEPRLEALAGALAEVTGPEADTQLHEVRIHIKRLRYVVELLEPLFGEAYRPLHERLRALQQDLGSHHDLYVLHELLLRVRDGLKAGGCTYLTLGLAPPLNRLAMEQRQLAEAFLRGSEGFDLEQFREELRAALS